MTPMRTTPNPEDDAWQRHVEALRRAIKARKPDAVQRIKAEVAKLDSQISALANRRELAAQTFANDQQRRQALHSATMATIERRITELAAKMDDLRAITKRIGSTMLDNDTGETPEAKQHPQDTTIACLSPEQCRAADDLREGYRTRLAGMMAGSGRYEPPMPPGESGQGNRVRALEERYGEWITLMGTSRMAIRWIVDIFGEGDQTIDGAAIAWKTDKAKVVEAIRYGLQLYADNFPSLDRRERLAV